MKKTNPPSAEDILDKIEIPEELAGNNDFLAVWTEWVHYKQNEAEHNDRLKPWNTLNAASRMLSEIRNRYKEGRDICHVINQSMLNQWIGIRFDLIEDRVTPLKSKTRDQVSALDLEWSKLNNPNQLN
tara:strand:+ start:133 stop:516 length:384 start_codon:yes stop_codon:yes gene_type:complete